MRTFEEACLHTVPLSDRQSTRILRARPRETLADGTCLTSSAGYLTTVSRSNYGSDSDGSCCVATRTIRMFEIISTN